MSGSVRMVARGVGRCQVQAGSHSEEGYERIKANHGQPLDVWRLDYSVYNGLGEAAVVAERAFQDRIGVAAVNELELTGGELCQAGAVGRELSGAAKAVWNGAGGGGERDDLPVGGS